MMNAYSDLKVAWDLDRLQELRDTGRTRPSQIQLVISDLCDNGCSFCAFRMAGYSSNQNFADEHGSNNPNRKIPYSKCAEILADAKQMGIEAVQFTGGGEPMVHPDHLRIFRLALDLGLKCALVTNGNRLSDGWKDVLPYFEWIRVSLDAGSPETYAAIRKVPITRFEIALANVARLAAEITSSRSSCYLGTSFVVTKENFREVGAATARAKECWARSIRFAAMFSPEMASYYDDIGTEVSARIRTAKTEMEDDAFEVIDLFTQRMGDLNQGKPDYTSCHYQKLNVYIGGDQKAYRCCNTAYNDLGDLGSLSGRRLPEWFNASETAKKYADFDARSCDHCAFNGKNRVLNYLAGEKPDHSEFA